MDKTETVSIIAICKDGGTKLVEYKGRKYHVDYRINSETSGRVYDDYPNRGNIISDHELEKEIQLALRDLLMKTETKEMDEHVAKDVDNTVSDCINSLRSELQKAKEEVRLLKFDYQAMFNEVKRLRSLLIDFEKTKELNGELVNAIKGLVSQRSFRGGFPHTTNELESLIKKSNP